MSPSSLYMGQKLTSTLKFHNFELHEMSHFNCHFEIEKYKKTLGILRGQITTFARSQV